MSNQLMSNMLTEVVMEKAIKDKYTELLKDQKPQQEKPKEEKKRDDSDLDSDDDFNDEEAEKIMKNLKFQQLQKAKVFQDKQKETFDAGDYREISEDEFLNYVTKNVYAAVHFYHNDFQKCKIMDMHLRKIAYGHPECRFLRLNAEKAPFFISKLAVQVLPTVITFENGIAKDRIVGFQDLGNEDDFDTMVLIRRLVKAGCIKPKNKLEKGFKMNLLKKKEESDDDDDY
ncbi:Thioredoxin-like fold [Pseudocohnilembus persalinus]|uniref:Thioredoxin-like fold n=1 Tax=Pseudocohnilembus persalinus TaxID=266149 RepID=A0A0V0QSF0_PSEPJ|nr:Thioredoxin-like fold [Pseudocohnilembus persalinus]|eukprot:KRX05196.1 Thioredoxin-like fold [Pseudocohnilembus persalinus]